MIRRREFIAGLGSAAAWPAAARAQQPAKPVVGYLSPSSPEPSAPIVAAFRKGLSEAGFVEGRDVSIEYRWADDQLDRLPDLAADLVRRQVSVIATPVASGALAAKAATTRIPIVFYSGPDPVQIGLVDSLSRPGGNLTGVGSMNSELTAKRLQLLRELLPDATRFAVLIRAGEAFAQSRAREVQSLSAAISQQIDVLNVGTNREIEAALARLAEKRVDGLLISNNILFLDRRVQLATLAVHYRLPTIYAWRESAEAGGLISYGTILANEYKQTGIYVGRILNGERPADLPVQQPIKFELIINLKTAKALGLAVPETLLVTADEVIE
jgi:putative ABC transport system substrate-binding protein